MEREWESQSDSSIVKVVDAEKVITPDGKIHIKSQKVYFNLLADAYIAILAWSGDRMVLHDIRPGNSFEKVHSGIIMRAAALLASEGLL